MTATDCDVVILGAGSGGYACALRAAQLGQTVTLIEEDKIGGTCLHRGCIPTKAFAHTAEVAGTVATAAAFGVESGPTHVDLATVHGRQRGIVDRLHQGLRGLISSRGITVVSGTGNYVGGTTVDVNGRLITGRALVLATGSRPRNLTGVELGARILTSDTALNHPVIPAHAVILGGGVIGVEFASIWSQLGAQVTIVEALPRLLAAEDEWTSTTLTRALRKRGITVLTNTRLSGAVDDGDAVQVALDGNTSIEADALLIAVGRAPRTDGIGLDHNGIEIDSNSFVRVDEQLRANVPGVYAVGDIVAGPQLAHRGFQQGIFVADIVAGLDPQPVADHLIPRVAYSAPQVAAVGLTEDQARQRFSEVQTAVYDLAGNAKSQILGSTGGVKVISGDGPVVGIHLVGDRVGELIGEAQLIVNWGAYPDEVANLIHAHPTQNEALGEAHLALAGRALHAHR